MIGDNFEHDVERPLGLGMHALWIHPPAFPANSNTSTAPSPDAGVGMSLQTLLELQPREHVPTHGITRDPGQQLGRTDDEKQRDREELNRSPKSIHSRITRVLPLLCNSATSSATTANIEGSENKNVMEGELLSVRESVRSVGSESGLRGGQAWCVPDVSHLEVALAGIEKELLLLTQGVNSHVIES